MLELNSVDGKPFRCMITNSGNITLLIDGQIHNLDKSHINYDKIKEAIAKRDIKNIKRLIDVESNIRLSFSKSNSSNGLVEVKNGEVLYNGEALHGTVVRRILDFQANNLPFEPLLLFLTKLMDNPSKRAVDELYGFLEKCNIPTTADGDFLSYKSLRSDYYDKYSGKILNKPGTVVEVPRNTVNDNCNDTCSAGLHTGGLGYSGPGGWYNNSGDKVVVVKVNPRDAVSVPTDHDMQKLRVCRYEVVRDFDAALDKPLYEVKNDEVKEYGSYDCGCASDYDNYDDDDEDDYDDYNEDEDNFDDEDLIEDRDTRENYKFQKRDKNGRFIKSN